MLLTGTFARSVDEKLRIAVPKRLRDCLGDPAPAALFITPGTDNSLALYTEEALARLAERLAHSSPTQHDVRAFSRLFYAQAQRVELDVQDEFAFRRSWPSWPAWRTKPFCWACRTTSNYGTGNAGRHTWPSNPPATINSPRPPSRAGPVLDPALLRLLRRPSVSFAVARSSHPGAPVHGHRLSFTPSASRSGSARWDRGHEKQEVSRSRTAAALVGTHRRGTAGTSPRQGARMLPEVGALFWAIIYLTHQQGGVPIWI